MCWPLELKNQFLGLASYTGEAQSHNLEETGTIYSQIAYFITFTSSVGQSTKLIIAPEQTADGIIIRESGPELFNLPFTKINKLSAVG